MADQVGVRGLPQETRSTLAAERRRQTFCLRTTGRAGARRFKSTFERPSHEIRCAGLAFQSLSGPRLTQPCLSCVAGRQALRAAPDRGGLSRHLPQADRRGGVLLYFRVSIASNLSVSSLEPTILRSTSFRRSSNAMPRAVKTAVVRCFMKEHVGPSGERGVNEIEARRMVEQLEELGRWSEECWS